LRPRLEPTRVEHNMGLWSMGKFQSLSVNIRLGWLLIDSDGPSRVP